MNSNLKDLFSKTKLFVFSLLLFTIIPLKSLPFLNGIPLDHSVDTGVILFLIFIFFILEWKPIDLKTHRKLQLFLVCGIILKLIVNACILQHGLKGYYYANNNFSGAYEKSTEFKNLDATRIDPKISFDTIGYSLTKTPFQLWFLNKYTTPELDFSVIWEGFLYVPKTREIEFSVVANDYAEVSIDGSKQAEIQARAVERSTFSAHLTQGFHPIKIRYAGHAKHHKKLNLGWNYTGSEKTISSHYFYSSAPPSFLFYLDTYSNIASYIFFILVVTIFLTLFIRHVIKRIEIKKLLTQENFLLFLFTLFFLIRAFLNLYKSAHEGGFNILSRGDDWLTYELHAQRILLGDWLDKTEAPFYFTPFYRYILAFTHALLGETIFMALMMQYFFFIASALFIYATAKKIFNLNTAVIAFLLFSLYSIPHQYSKVLLTEISAVFFSCASIYFLVSFLKEEKHLFKMITSGILMGIAIIIRPNLSPFLLFIVPYFLLTHKHKIFKIRLTRAIIYAASVLLIISCVTMRNYIVSHRFVVFSTIGPTNLYLTNTPPASVNFENIDKNRIYNFFSLDPAVRKVIEYAKQQPKLFFQRWAVKLGFIMGMDPKGLGEQGKNFFADRFLTFVFFAMGFLYFLYTMHFSLINIPSILGIFIFTTIVTLVIVAEPWGYGGRYQLPAVPFMLLFTAYFLDTVLNTVAIHLKKPAFYLSYGLLLTFFTFLVARKHALFMCIFYSIFYFWTHSKLKNDDA